MDKTLLGLLGGASALALVTGAQATPAPEPAGGLEPARSYAELLQPIPNALEILAATEEETAAAEGTEPPVQLAQWHHHHHHHHHGWRPAYRYYWRPHFYHHHHHHHHHHRYNYY